MKKQYKIMFKGASRSLRKTLTEISKPGERFRMDHTVPRPDWIAGPNGIRVRYQGP